MYEVQGQEEERASRLPYLCVCVVVGGEPNLSNRQKNNEHKDIKKKVLF